MALLAATGVGQGALMNKGKLEIKRTDDFQITSLDDKAWQAAQPVAIKTYWSGYSAPAGRQLAARLLWSKTALYVRFEANQTEPLVVS